MSRSPRRLGMFGGAFDPPHRAHVAMAQAAVAQFGLDELRIVPTGQAWHKQRTLSPAEHRLAMTRLAFAGVERTVVDGRELRRQGPTYTVDTLRELQAEQPDATLHLLIGEDQARDFTTWRDWQEIARLAVLCVAQRPGHAVSGLAVLQGLPGARVQALQIAPMDVSATDIRARLTSGRDIAQLVAPGVASYIAQHHLYPKP